MIAWCDPDFHPHPLPMNGPMAIPPFFNTLDFSFSFTWGVFRWAAYPEIFRPVGRDNRERLNKHSCILSFATQLIVMLYGGDYYANIRSLKMS